jgi:mono/diheme cytochrome c family protein
MILRTSLGLAIMLGALALGACGEKKPETAAMQGATKSEQAATAPNASPAATETAQAPAEGMHTGKEIHDANCVSCHDSGVYTRADHKMQDFTQLDAQVRRCDANLGKPLSDADIDKVIAYLNDTYYKFDKK